MRDILSATGRVVARRLGFVVVVAIGIALPGEILVEAPGDTSGLIAIVGIVVTLLASVTLVLVLLRDLQSRSLPLASIVPSVVRATLRTIGAFLILAVLSVIPLFIGTVLVVSLFHGGSAAVAVTIVLVGMVTFFAAPVSLVVPVCLSEDGGPWWALNRAWAISRPRRGQARLLLGGLSVLTFGVSWLLRGFGPAAAPSAALILVAVVGTVVAAGFLAVLYERLTQEPRATTSPAL
jgi:hypothetical protein